MLKQAHVFVKGDVIGVGFRAWTKIQAKINGVTGWVKNSFDRPDIFGPAGGVEAQIQGEETGVQNMLKALSQGSPISHINGTEVIWQDPKEIFDGFDIRK